MSVLVLFLFFSLTKADSCHRNQSGSECIPDYYWRDFSGDIPCDAIVGGKDSKTGKPFYVGQVNLPHGHLLPASIFSGQSDAITSTGMKVIKTNKHLKILCSPNKSQFVWKTIKTDDLPLFPIENVITGGTENGETLFIGRVFHNGHQILGKIFQHHLHNRGLWIPNGKIETNYLSYQILLYECEKDQFNTPLAE